MNIREIARLAGVSPSTVSRVLNGTKAVAPEVKERVFRLVEETGYVPNAVKRHTRTIAVVIPKTFTSHGWSGEILDGILDGAGTHAVTLIRQEAPESASVHFWQQQVRQAGLKGVLFVATERTPSLAMPVRQTGIPFVIMGRGEPTDHWVWCDNVAVIAHALEMLYQEGHRNIAYIGFPGPHPDHKDRLHTYRCYMAARGLKGVERLLEMERPLPVDIVKILDCRQPPTALFVAGTNTALFTLSLLGERGIAVPGDLAFVAIGPHPVLEARQPPMPLVTRQLHAGAKLAVESLLSLDDSADRLIQCTLPSHLVCGGKKLPNYPIPDLIQEELVTREQDNQV